MLPLRNEQALSILAWNTCTARCAHCGPDSKPEDKTGLTHDSILVLINEASQIYGRGWCLSLSGGEIFLHYERLLEYAGLAQELGGYTTLISNCFWATSEALALEKLEPLVERNLLLLGISSDHFHTPYVPVYNVKNAIRAAKKLKLTVEVRSVASKSGRLSDVLRELEDAYAWYTRFIEMPLVPDGRGKLIDSSELFLSEETPKGKCPAASLTINAAGQAMVCCNGGGYAPALQVGNIGDCTLEQLEYAFAADPIVLFLKNAGPIGCLEYISKEQRNTVLSKKYVNECHLCIELFTDPTLVGSIGAGIETDFAKAMQGPLHLAIENFNGVFCKATKLSSKKHR